MGLVTTSRASQPDFGLLLCTDDGTCLGCSYAALGKPPALVLGGSAPGVLGVNKEKKKKKRALANTACIVPEDLLNNV